MPRPRPIARGLLTAALALAALACKPVAPDGLPEGPPSVDGSTVLLPAFDPNAFTGPGQTGLDLASAEAGPPPPPAPPEPAPLPDPEVIDYGPQGEASAYPTIQLRFNRPMVPLGAKQRTSAAEAGFTITPAIEGDAYWAEPTRLVFEPKTALQLAQDYEVSFDRKLESVDGPELDVDLSWSFGTEPPRVSLRAASEGQMLGGRHHWETSVELEPSQELTLAELREHTRAFAYNEQGDRHAVDVEISRGPRRRSSGRPRSFVIEPATRWPADAEIVIEVDGELTGEAGPRPLGETERYSFSTAAGVELHHLTCTRGHHDDGCELGPLELRFTAPISRKAAQKVSIEPAPPGLERVAIGRQTDASGRALDAYDSVMLWGDFARGTTYTVVVERDLEDVHGQPLVGSAREERVFVEPPPSLELRQDYGTFVRASGATLGIETRHVDRLRVRTTILDRDELERALLGEGNWSDWVDELTPRDETITLAHSGAWGWSAHELDLRARVSDKPAAVFVEVGVEALSQRAAGRKVPRSMFGLVQISELGVTALGSAPRGLIRVAQLEDDAPVAGAEVEILAGHGGERKALGKTDTRGLLELPGAGELPDEAVVHVRRGSDHVYVRADRLANPSDEDEVLRRGEEVETALTTERQLYRPGERVRAMGWAAISTPHELSGLRQLPAKTKVEIELHDQDGELVAERTVHAKDHGKFWATLDVPETAALGNYRLTATLLGNAESTGLRVEDFRTPEFSVTASTDKTDLHPGESTRVRVDASYFFGGRVPLIRAREATRCSQIDYRPPGLDAGWDHAPRPRYGIGGFGTRSNQRTLGPRASEGHLDYELDAPVGSTSFTLHCTHSVALADATQRELGAETSLTVHPPFYLAAHGPGSLDAGEDASIEIQTLDFDGSPVSVKDVEVRLVRTWSEPRYAGKRSRELVEYRQRTRKLSSCKVSSAGRTQCDFSKLEHGSYAIEVIARRGDYEARIDSWLWVSQDTGYSWSSTPVQALSVELSTPRPGQAVAVGDALEARIRAPWSSGSGLLLLTKGGIHEVHPFELTDGQAELPFEVADAWIPRVNFLVVAVEPGNGGRKLPRVRYDQTSVEIDQGRRELRVAVRAPQQAETRERIPIEVEVHDHAGDPTPGHVSVWAVDEALLSLAPLELPDFVDRFAVHHWGDPGIVDSYGQLQRAYQARADDYRPWLYTPLEGSASGVGGLGLVGTGRGGGGTGAGTIGLGNTGLIGHGGGSAGASMPRSQFSSAPIFIGDAEVGPDGIARVEGELPDNLTTFRLTAVASAPLASGGQAVEARFGTGDARVRVTRPLVVRAAMPRVMRPGDQAELGVLVDNLGAGGGEVEVEVELHDAEGLLELLGPSTAKATLDSGGQLRLPFQIRATGFGAPQVELRAHLREPDGTIHVDALRLPLPVEPERTQTDRVAVYGSLDQDGAALLPFALPDDADPGVGGMSVSVATSMLGGLEDAVAYLVDYPHGCLEQTSSSLLPLIPLGRLASAGYPLGIDDLDGHVAHGIKRLRSMQLDGGGFAYWPGGDYPAPYASAYAAWVLTRASAAGYRVPKTMIEGVDAYLRALVGQWLRRRAPGLGEDIEMALALWALAERGQASAEGLDTLYERRRRLPVFSQATLLAALNAQARAKGHVDPRSAELLTELKSLVDEREAVAKVETSSSWTWYWDSNIRSSALVLMALVELDPHHPLATKLARGLLEARRGGRWSNTQENAYALVALADYAAVYEATPPDFEARVWLGSSMLASARAEGRSFEHVEGFTPMDELLDATHHSANEDRLLLERAGVGRMYYRVGLEWTSTNVDKPAAAEGIRIGRALRNEAGPLGRDAAVHAGELLAIDVEIEVPAALDHVAIEVPVPAGIETVNLSLGRGTAAMKLQGERGAWVSHEQLRRDRAVLFADHLEPGMYKTTVFARATTPGEYQMPAASAEMMYYPEVYGRTTARRLLVR